jgi:hypothetical protein
MDHSYYKERISAYADNALPPYEQMAVQEHLESCPECRVALEKFLKLTIWIDSEANLGGDEYFELQAQKIEARLGLVETEVTPVGKKTWRGLGWKLTTVAASIALVGIVVYLSKDTVLQKSEPPVMNAPAIRDEKERGRSHPAESVDLKSTRPETTVSGLKPLSEPDDIAIPVELPEATVGEVKLAPTVEESNYKVTPQVELKSPIMPMETAAVQVESKPKQMAEADRTTKERIDLQSAAGKAVDSISGAPKAKRDVLSKFEVSGQLPKSAESIQHKPVQEFDDILKSVAGVKTDSNGNVFIRGGRAGELSDSFQERPMQRVDDQGISTLDVSITSEPAPEADSLVHWRTIRDSLEQEKQAGVVGKVLSQANRIMAKKSGPSALADRPPEPKVTLAEAYFRIAKISRDSTEIARATDSLKRIAADAKSPDQAQAKAYLDSLRVK